MTYPSFSKFKQISFAFILTLVTLFILSKHSNNQSIQAWFLSPCSNIESKLPMNHINHPCHTTNMSSNSWLSWLSWLSGESKSTHLHFLDLVELIHYNRH